ncbi:hypothetical protein [Spirilliplanes yamanashiensis]|uniref:Uncharacterized protein n=1 Tax=Spirilliplanes yamanashiensis TaxID=42233 RepID=A0A8J4DM58_9ACTN|nr:hypothetical protein [Spirilliplanes yamanashiensis]MDP9818283.1 hypothetical protein [Spirilliplanes yamanashiensis]GIJ06701.1 hypothetical protein Sya03_60530 [Spirilliplanes yamanashiensis]
MWWVILFVVLVLTQAWFHRWARRRAARPAGRTPRVDPCLGPIIAPPQSTEGRLARGLIDGAVTPGHYRRAMARLAAQDGGVTMPRWPS